MDATPINFETAIPLGDGLPAGQAAYVDPMTGRWTALHEAAFIVATLADVADPVLAPDVVRFPEAVRRAPHWRRELAGQGLEDLTAIMEPGLAALIAVHTSGADAAAPARALWQEFVSARDALVRMVTPEG